LVGGALGALLALAGGGAASAQIGELRGVTVSGEGRAYAPPDTAEIQAGVVTEAPTATAAFEGNGRAMQQVLAALERLGVAAKNVQTQQVELSPEYRHHPEGREPPRIAGYRASHLVRVKVQKLDDLGRILDQVAQAGANQIHGIQLLVGDPSPLLDEARRRAVTDARRRAELYAGAAGVRLGRPLHLEEEPPSGPGPLPRLAMQAESLGATPIAPGEVEVAVRVRATFAIE
jgi:hypothetical protein